MEAVKVNDLDGEAVKQMFAKAKSAMDGAEAGSVAKAEAQVQTETARAMANALGMSV
jgi:uncharacterized protein YdgA (DUF945 family)